jgi:hypothetical protein
MHPPSLDLPKAQTIALQGQPFLEESQATFSESHRYNNVPRRMISATEK